MTLLLSSFTYVVSLVLALASTFPKKSVILLCLGLRESLELRAFRVTNLFLPFTCPILSKESLWIHGGGPEGVIVWRVKSG